MIVHQVYAQIFEGEVKNIMICKNYEMANWLTRATYGEKAFAVDCLQYPCEVGDKYHDGGFWRINESNEEAMLRYVPTQVEQVHKLTVDNNELMIAMADIVGGVEG